MINETDIAYIAGLFDGEGNINIAKRREKKKRRDGTVYETNCWRISMEIAMTDQSVLIWLHEVLGVGTLNPKPRKNGHKCNTDGVVYLEIALGMFVDLAICTC